MKSAITQIHYGAQIAAAAGNTLAAPRDDHSHTNFRWSDEIGGIVGQPLESGKRVALRFADLTLLVIGANGASLESQALPGSTLQEATRWLALALSTDKLALPEHELPAHRLGEDAAFEDTPVDELERVTALFATANRVLMGQADGRTVALWPHHFDIAFLIEVATDKSVGVGFSPGDTSYDEPYWYVTPWPYPENSDATALPELPGAGQWHVAGWTGAVLVHRDHSEEKAAEFLSAAILACKSLL